MFQLSVVDHIRLSFGHVVFGYRAHSRAAGRLALRAWQLRVTLMILTGASTASAVIALYGDRRFQIAAAVIAGVAFALYATSAALDLDARAYAHRACAARLWAVCERYRALLAEAHDGLLDIAAVTEKRDALQRDVQAVYEHGLPVDRDAYQIAGQAVSDSGAWLSDQALDQFLPRSLRQAKA
jgi:hypothetical protein